MKQVKYELYTVLRVYHHHLHNLGQLSEPDRLREQAKVEERFVRVLHLFQTKLSVPSPFATSDDSLIVRNLLSKDALGRPHTRETVKSLTTSLSTDTRFPLGWRPPADFEPDLVSFYQGQYSVNGSRAMDLLNVECGTFTPDDLVYVCLHDGQHTLVLGDMATGSGFFAAATSIFVDAKENRIWIAGDIRVRGFELSTLQHVDTLVVRNEIVTKSAITVWGGRLVLAVDNEIFLWDLGATEGESLGTLGLPYRERSSPPELDLASVDWTAGRLPCEQEFEIAFGNITSVAAVGAYLAIASDQYEAIHLFKESSGGRIAVRLVGHCMGITCLLSWKGESLFSGSGDRTIGLWNLSAGCLDASFLRHDGDITAITVGQDSENEFLFTGGKDGAVHAWDLTRKKPMFELDVGEHWYPTALAFVGARWELLILSTSDQEDPELVTAPWKMQIYSFRPEA